MNTEANDARTELRVDEGGVWAIRSTSATVAYLDLDRGLLLLHRGPGSPRFPYDGCLVPLVRITSMRGDTGVVRVGDRHEFVTDPRGPDFGARCPGGHPPGRATLRARRRPGQVPRRGRTMTASRRGPSSGGRPVALRWPVEALPRSTAGEPDTTVHTTGRWVVRTRSSAYLVDLDATVAARVPATRAPADVLIAQLRRDGDDIPLRALAAAIGAPMCLALAVRDDGARRRDEPPRSSRSNPHRTWKQHRPGSSTMADDVPLASAPGGPLTHRAAGTPPAYRPQEAHAPARQSGPVTA